ncbi:MAG: diphthine--ammonia ligase [Clostridium sp.]|uniref:Dph6-related ATP pyrophosphatase n=1 Tax=Clostridium sp. TaxID=1506 RepID=UPI002A8D3F7A|nr:diphthine--ammonia ligase [Clostridium sp.]MDY5099505.1 diphthine--ammonia ligase [Clostridium sp.]
MGKKFIMSYSCGKDSTLALYRMIKEGNIPVGLLVTIDKDRGQSWFHGVPRHILQQVSKSLNIPLVPVECEGDQYETIFEEVLKNQKALGATACVFGDIDIEHHRTWCTDRCVAAEMEAIFPLWQEDREKLTYEFIDSGFKTVLKNVKLEFLGEEFLGKILTRELVKKIKETGADPCGENGEYHTFVFDGPIYNEPVAFEIQQNTLTDSHGYLNIK